jgi:hypothetical protein
MGAGLQFPRLQHWSASQKPYFLIKSRLSLAFCHLVFTGYQAPDLGTTYYTNNAPVVDQQIAKVSVPSSLPNESVVNATSIRVDTGLRRGSIRFSTALPSHKSLKGYGIDVVYYKICPSWLFTTGFHVVQLFLGFQLNVFYEYSFWGDGQFPSDLAGILIARKESANHSILRGLSPRSRCGITRQPVNLAISLLQP